MGIKICAASRKANMPWRSVELCCGCQGALTVTWVVFMAVCTEFCFFPWNNLFIFKLGIVTVYTRIVGHMPADVKSLVFRLTNFIMHKLMSWLVSSAASTERIMRDIYFLCIKIMVLYLFVYGLFNFVSHQDCIALP
jgi:hypothetical protein